MKIICILFVSLFPFRALAMDPPVNNLSERHLQENYLLGQSFREREQRLEKFVNRTLADAAFGNSIPQGAPQLVFAIGNELARVNSPFYQDFSLLINDLSGLVTVDKDNFSQGEIEAIFKARTSAEEWLNKQINNYASKPRDKDQEKVSLYRKYLHLINDTKNTGNQEAYDAYLKIIDLAVPKKEKSKSDPLLKKKKKTKTCIIS